jgi:Flp pilus assembly protein TadG
MRRTLLSKVISFKRDDRGLQLVELAITLPIMILLFAAAAEFGRYFQEYTTLAKGSRVSARYLATRCFNGADDLAAQNLVVYGNTAGTGSPIVNGLGIENVDIGWGNGAGGPAPGFPTTVTVRIVNFNHSPLFNVGQLMGNSLSMNIAVKPSVTMRYLLTQAPSC